MRIAMISVHSSPIAQLGGKEAGGMNMMMDMQSRMDMMQMMMEQMMMQHDEAGAH